ncbi:DUF4251 domain-containing protein [Winogradskyella pulchriflava]|uniref:DUF4251 domain-containing protein n=1 Tax=Winogradskyella pulchriflava TaxID=1110688 RepID=A0ABV6QBR1_9FLAO
MKHIIILALLFSFSATTFVDAQSKTTQKEQFQSTYNTIKALVKSKNFEFVGEVVFSDAGRKRVDGDTNSLSINESKGIGSLSMLSSDTETVKIDGDISNYNVNFNDDMQNIAIQFSVNKMTVYIDIKPNGNAILTVETGVNKITQLGKLKSI